MYGYVRECMRAAANGCMQVVPDKCTRGLLYIAIIGECTYDTKHVLTY